jgi:hypothetical protein
VSSNSGGAQSGPVDAADQHLGAGGGRAGRGGARLAAAQRFYYAMPALPWLPIIVVGALAVAEFFLAQNTAARVQRRPGAPPVNALAVARYAVLAKASSLAGALSAGFSAGLLAWLALEPTKAARDDVPAALAGVIVALALVGAALWLERACRVPDQPDRTDEDDPKRRAG